MSGKAENLKGQTFGYLKVISRAESTGRSKWVCECKLCGNTHIAESRFLKSGAIKSCGCKPKGAEPGEIHSRDICRPSISLGRLKSGNSDPYQNLANAIVAVAVDDYRMALQENDTKLLKSLRKFFCSEWCKMLTAVDMGNVLRLIHKESDGSLNAVYI